ncbi:hypothetical protein DFH09DRAFT_1139816, partial [Mycena vulgaris]
NNPNIWSWFVCTSFSSTTTLSASVWRVVAKQKSPLNFAPRTLCSVVLLSGISSGGGPVSLPNVMCPSSASISRTADIRAFLLPPRAVPQAASYASHLIIVACTRNAPLHLPLLRAVLAPRQPAAARGQGGPQ